METRNLSIHRKMISAVSELVALPSPQQALDRLSEALSCPIAVIGSGRKMCSSGASHLMNISRKSLSDVKNITVAGKPTSTGPDIEHVMLDNGVGAVIPFHCHVNQSLGYLIVGRNPEDDGVSPFDFRAVESLFEKLGDQFLDSLASMRTQSEEVAANLHALRQRIAELELDNRALRTLVDTQEMAGTKVGTDETERETVLDALEGGETLDSLTAQYEGTLIKWALKQCRGNKAKAARMLKVRPNTFHYKILRRNIDDTK